MPWQKTRLGRTKRNAAKALVFGGRFIGINLPRSQSRSKRSTAGASRTTTRLGPRFLEEPLAKSSKQPIQRERGFAVAAVEVTVVQVVEGVIDALPSRVVLPLCSLHSQGVQQQVPAPADQPKQGQVAQKDQANPVGLEFGAARRTGKMGPPGVSCQSRFNHGTSDFGTKARKEAKSLLAESLRREFSYDSARNDFASFRKTGIHGRGAFFRVFCIPWLNSSKHLGAVVSD